MGCIYNTLQQNYLVRCVLWKSCFKNFQEIYRKATAAELIFSISCQLCKISGQLFHRTPFNGFFRFNNFSIKNGELWWSSAVLTNWFRMFDGKVVVDTNLYSIPSG